MKKEKLVQVRKWDYFERVLSGKTEGNPYDDYGMFGTFESDNETKTVEGFYDGNGKYVIRFMPSFEGVYTYRISGSFSDEVTEGSFEVKAPLQGVHGPVTVSDRFHFNYADSTPFYCVGTTCYAWEFQNDKLMKKTLSSLKAAGFNKLRFCIFPKHYVFNLEDPQCFPFEGTPMDRVAVTPDNYYSYTGRTSGNNWDFTRFNPEYFKNLERCILSLCDLGIEADLIVFHPYDRWGFAQMNRSEDTRYIRYLINRFSAFRNVWWSMANEFDLLEHKTDEDWDYIGGYFAEHDPYNHLRSIHNCVRLYDHTKDWVTHVSFQRINVYKTAEAVNDLRNRYGKPVMLDEICYEGDMPYGWGNITGEEMVRRFWEGTLRGGYPGHGETYLSKDNIIWWSHGGKLKGDSWKRVKFLMNIMNETPGHGLKYKNMDWDCVGSVPEDDKAFEETGYRIMYFGIMRPSYREINIRDGFEYEAEIIDTWNMTVKKVEGVFSGNFRIDLPGRQYMAIRLRKKGH